MEKLRPRLTPCPQFPLPVKPLQLVVCVDGQARESHSVSTATLFAVKKMGVGPTAAEVGPQPSFSLTLEPTLLPASSGFQLSSGSW